MSTVDSATREFAQSGNKRSDFKSWKWSALIKPRSVGYADPQVAKLDVVIYGMVNVTRAHIQ